MVTLPQFEPKTFLEAMQNHKVCKFYLSQGKLIQYDSNILHKVIEKYFIYETSSFLNITSINDSSVNF